MSKMLRNVDPNAGFEMVQRQQAEAAAAATQQSCSKSDSRSNSSRCVNPQPNVCMSAEVRPTREGDKDRTGRQSKEGEDKPDQENLRDEMTGRRVNVNDSQPQNEKLRYATENSGPS